MTTQELNNLIDITLENLTDEFPFDFEDHEVQLIDCDLDVDINQLLLEDQKARNNGNR